MMYFSLTSLVDIILSQYMIRFAFVHYNLRDSPAASAIGILFSGICPCVSVCVCVCVCYSVYLSAQNLKRNEIDVT